MSKTNIYKAYNVITGEEIIGLPGTVAKVIGVKSTRISEYYIKHIKVNGVWEIDSIGFKPNKKTDYSEFDNERLEKLRDQDGRIKCLSLWDAYKSGRSAIWNLDEIAHEFYVPVDAVKQILQEEGVL